MKLFGGLPLWGATAILGVITVIGVYFTVHYHDLLWLVIAIVIVVVIGALFLREYTQRPLAERPVLVPGSMSSLAPARVGDPPTLKGTPTPELVDDDSEFDDPVIEADRIASGEAVPEPTDGVDGGPAPKPTKPATPP